jgi:hypothetical protein
MVIDMLPTSFCSDVTGDIAWMTPFSKKRLAVSIQLIHEKPRYVQWARSLSTDLAGKKSRMAGRVTEVNPLSSTARQVEILGCNLVYATSTS